jgi:hypothetical protein
MLTSFFFFAIRSVRNAFATAQNFVAVRPTSTAVQPKQPASSTHVEHTESIGNGFSVPAGHSPKSRIFCRAFRGSQAIQSGKGLPQALTHLWTKTETRAGCHPAQECRRVNGRIAAESFHGLTSNMAALGTWQQLSPKGLVKSWRQTGLGHKSERGAGGQGEHTLITGGDGRTRGATAGLEGRRKGGGLWFEPRPWPKVTQG